MSQARLKQLQKDVLSNIASSIPKLKQLSPTARKKTKFREKSPPAAETTKMEEEEEEDADEELVPAP